MICSVDVDRLMRRWRRGYNSCSRTDLEYAPVVSGSRQHDDARRHDGEQRMSAMATVKSCQSSIMSTGGHFGRPAVSSATASSLAAIRDTRRLDLAKPRSTDYMEASDF